MNKFTPRTQAPLLERALGTMPVVVVTGARQSGKTTLVRDLHQESGRRYFTLDRLEILEQAKSYPLGLLEDLPVTLDEVQREPGLLLAVKEKVDQERKPGMVLLTGSANLSLMKTVSESLAGRAFYLELPPFCPVEWKSTAERDLAPLDRLFNPEFKLSHWPAGSGDWKKWLLRGGFAPALSIRDEDRDLWFSGYVQTYLERDLRQLANIENLANFQRLMRLSANRVAKILNQSDLARDCEFPQPTVHRYMNLLEVGYQVSRLPVYSTNPVGSLVKARKLFWNDCGLAAWLAGIDSLDALERRVDIGYWLEQAVFQTLQSWRSLEPARRRVYYWRNRVGDEVDFILEKNGKLVAVEIKASGSVQSRDASGLRAFRHALGSKQDLVRSVILHGGAEARVIGEGECALPFGWMFPAD